MTAARVSPESAVRCMLMRGGTSKGLFFIAEDIPSDRAGRDDLLLRLMGSPDPLQIDGLGGATPVTSKVAIVSPSRDDEADIDYLFLQLGVDAATVSDEQNCGNLLAAVGPFAVERGLITSTDPETAVRIRMVNSDSIAVARFETRAGAVKYDGDTAIAGVPGTAASVVLEFRDTVGSTTGALFPSGHRSDVIAGDVRVTCVDNGMPVVVIAAGSLGCTGYESHDALKNDRRLLDRIDKIRCEAGELMGLSDVRGLSVPKTTLVAAANDGGMLATRSFIPVQPHPAIGVLGAISVATAVRFPGAVGHELTEAWPEGMIRVDIEHASGHVLVEVDVDATVDPPQVRRSGIVRTARKLFDGVAFARSS